MNTQAYFCNSWPKKYVTGLSILTESMQNRKVIAKIHLHNQGQLCTSCTQKLNHLPAPTAFQQLQCGPTSFVHKI